MKLKPSILDYLLGFEEINSIIEAFRREQKINEILDEDDC